MDRKSLYASEQKGVKLFFTALNEGRQRAVPSKLFDDWLPTASAITMSASAVPLYSLSRKCFCPTRNSNRRKRTGILSSVTSNYYSFFRTYSAKTRRGISFSAPATINRLLLAGCSHIKQYFIADCWSHINEHCPVNNRQARQKWTCRLLLIRGNLVFVVT